MKLISFVNLVFILILYVPIMLVGCGGGNTESDAYPCIIQKIGEYQISGLSSKISVNNNIAIIDNIKDPWITSNLHFVDISDPAKPELISAIELDNEAYDFVINGDAAYIIQPYYYDDDWVYRLAEIDLSSININSTELPVGRSLLIDEYPTSFVLNGSFGYLLNELGVNVVDLSTFTITSTVGSTSSYYMKVYGEQGYVTGFTNAIDIFDLTSPGIPELLGSYPNLYGICPNSIYAVGNYVGLMLGGNGIALFDITNPENISPMEVFNTGGWAEDLTSDGNYAFLADGNDGLIVLDISTPTDPIVLGECFVGGYAKKVLVSGDYVYVLVVDKGFVVFDKSGLE